MREVILKLTTQKDLIKHQSAATTFGELKDELPNISWDGMRVVERSTKATLQMDEAVLPQEDFILFLVPEKVKAGMTKKEGGLAKLKNPIEDSNYNELRSHMSWLNRNKDAKLDVSGSVDDLRKKLKKYYKKNDINTPTSKKTPPKKDEKKKAAPVKAKTKEKPAAKAEEKEQEKPKLSRAAQLRADAEAAIKKAEEELKEAERIEEEEREAAEKAEKAEQERIAREKNPVNIIENSKDIINKAIDDILKNIHTTPPVALQFSVDDLEKEIKVIREALKTTRYSKIA